MTTRRQFAASTPLLAASALSQSGCSAGPATEGYDGTSLSSEVLGQLQRSPSSGHLLMTILNLPLVLLLVGPLREDFGWCGCALPVLQNRLGWRAASMALWLLESVHVPTLIVSSRDDGYGTFASARYTAGRTASGRTRGNQR